KDTHENYTLSTFNPFFDVNAAPPTSASFLLLPYRLLVTDHHNETGTRDLLLTRQALCHLSNATIDIMKTNSLYNLKVS
ncbi:Uncharacterized protein APZ42_009103, partial [Daphnia magna]